MALQEEKLANFVEPERRVPNIPFPGAEDFQPFRLYTKDTIIYREYILYRARRNFKADSFFNPSDWERITFEESHTFWGGISGNLSDQADLQSELNAINSSAETLGEAVSALQDDFNSWIGRGGFLDAFDFGSPTPAQADLTNYALSQISSITDPLLIWNGTRVVNLNNGHTWILNNTQDTDPPVFEWTDQGPSSMGPFVQNGGGYIVGADPAVDGDGFIEALPGGKGKVIGLSNLPDSRPATFVIGTTQMGHLPTTVDYLCTGTNDELVINQAIQDLPYSGGLIVIREGAYNLQAAVNINRDNACIQGMGQSTMLNFSNTESAVIISANYCKLTDIKIMGQNIIYNVFISGSYNLVDGCYLNATTEFYTTINSFGVYLYSSATTGTPETAATYNTISRNYIANGAGIDGRSYGIYMGFECNNNRIIQNIFANFGNNVGTVRVIGMWFDPTHRYTSVIANNFQKIQDLNPASYLFTNNGTASVALPGNYYSFSHFSPNYYGHAGLNLWRQ